MFYLTAFERSFLNWFYEICSVVTFLLFSLTMYLLIYEKSHATKMHKMLMINITISSQLCDFLAVLCQPIIMIPYGALYCAAPWVLPKYVLLLGLFFFFLLINNVGTTLEFSAIHKVKLADVGHQKLIEFFEIKAFSLMLAVMFGVFFVIGSSLYYGDLCMGSFHQCQSWFTEDLSNLFINETSVIVFRWNRITTIGVIYAGVVTVIAGASFSFLIYLVITETKALKTHQYISQTALQMQRYFSNIFLLQSMGVLLFIVLPCFLLALAIFGVNFLPEAFVSSPCILMFLHSASNSLIIIFSTESYRKAVKSWLRLARKNRIDTILVTLPFNSVVTNHTRDL